LGLKAYYGDASRVEILRMAGAAEARILLLMIDNEASALKIVREVRHHFPHVKILARATNRQHAYELIKLGITDFYHEMVGSAVDLTQGALLELGFSREVFEQTTGHFKEYEKK